MGGLGKRLNSSSTVSPLLWVKDLNLIFIEVPPRITKYHKLVLRQPRFEAQCYLKHPEPVEGCVHHKYVILRQPFGWLPSAGSGQAGHGSG